jgi:hypothetical protein
MEDKQFPQELTDVIGPTLSRYKSVGWHDVVFGWPTASNSATNKICLHATSPSGERVHAIFEDDEDLIGKLDAFLGARS